MTISELIILIVAFIAPITYQRVHFFLKRENFEKISKVREKSGLQIHHGHWGILFIFITTLYTVFIQRDIFTIIGFGYGWGLLIDEIIPSLKTPSKDRELELKIYSEAKRPTLILVLTIITLFLILFLAV